MTELAVLVPVLNRPKAVAPLVESFLAHCPPDSYLHFIVNEDDTEELDSIYEWTAGKRAGFVGAGFDECRTWPKKINLGVQEVQAGWYLCAADDIRFTEGWWDATAELRSDLRVGVIGTNDSAMGRGNPRVAAGEHTCHPLIRSSYVRDFGTVDAPGLAVHPGYAHWFVDDELVWTAKARGAWAFCREAVVEHLHPYWGYGEMDDTYRLGEAHANEDAELWQKRAPLLGLQVQ